MDKEDFIYKQCGFDSYYNIWHTSGKNMIIYIHSGTGSIVEDKKSHHIKAGCLCFIGGDKFHYTLPNNLKDYVRSKVFVSDKQLSEMLNVLPDELNLSNIFLSSSLLYAEIPQHETKKIENLIDEIKVESEENSNRAVLLCNYMRLMLYIYKYTTDSLPVLNGTIQKAVEYINSNISENILIDNVCDFVHLSKYHFCRKFKQTIGCTVMEYILKTRIINAQVLLKSTTLSISEISLRCGFSSISYFCRIFKENLNCTPIQYRKKINKKQDEN